MKILLINQAFYPDKVATAQYLSDLAILMVEAGHEVTVLCGREMYMPPHSLYPKSEKYKGINIIRTGSSWFGRGFKLGRVIDALWINVAFAWKLLWFRRYDKVMALTSPPLVAFIALLFAKWKKSDFYYWVMDLNPDEAIIAGWLRAGSFEARLLNAVLRFILKNSDKTIVLDRFMKDRILAKGASSESVSVVPPWPNEELMPSIAHSDNPFRDAHKLQDKFVVMYSGNHSICHPLDTVLEVAKTMRDRSEVVFLFVGGGVRVDDVTQFREKHKLENIVQLGYQDREQLKYSLTAADLQLVVIGEPYVGIVHPCKIYGIFCSQRPFFFIGPKESHVGELIEKYQIGGHAEHGDVDGMVSGIEAAMRRSEDEVQAIAEKSAAIVANDLNPEKLVAQVFSDMSLG